MPKVAIVKCLTEDYACSVLIILSFCLLEVTPTHSQMHEQACLKARNGGYTASKCRIHDKWVHVGACVKRVPKVTLWVASMELVWNQPLDHPVDDVEKFIPIFF